MTKNESDRKITRLRRLVQRAEAAEASAAGRLGACYLAYDEETARYNSLADYELKEPQVERATFIGNGRRFAASVVKAAKAQKSVVEQHQGQVIAAEADWVNQREKLKAMTRSLAAILNLERQNLAKVEQNVTDDLISQSEVMRANL
ncbi:MAG: glycerol-3-phosphate cytidylyltransferase-like family protein [Candidatus Azotimanducaceae bacterium]|jgi:glycerol-3-phosphate cytidylyltransferase-like family protein